jgi:hypothetical protein
MVTKNKIAGKDIDPKYYEKLAQIESSGDPNAKAQDNCPPGEVCTASGLYQFTERTWKENVENLGLDYTLEDRFDPTKSRKVVEAFTQKNAKYLERKLGRTPTENELYLAHFLGMGGARKFLTAYQDHKDLPIESIITTKQINSNPGVFKGVRTVGDLYKWSENKMGVQGYKPPKNDIVYGYDQNNEIIYINPEAATEEQKRYSYLVKDDYFKSLYMPDAEEYTTVEENETIEDKTPIVQEEEVEEVPFWKLALEKKQQERDTIVDFITQGGLDYQAPEYERQVLPQQASQQKFQDGGQIPTSENGLYDYPQQMVVVPTKNGKITMKGINYPVLGIADTGEEVLMQPEKEYHFKGATEVLEIPQFKKK